MNKKSRKLLTWCLVLSMVLTQVLFTNVALAATRHEGTDRYQTALSVVKAGWTTAETVVIAQGEELADALAAAPLAYAKGKAPILLTEPNKLPEGVLDELTALGTKTVYIVGGTGAVSSDVEAALAAKVGAANVIRLGGADRVETALKVANAAFPTAPTGVVLAGAYAYADALSASSIAAAKGMPILLVDGKLTDAEASYVAGKTVYAVGGTGVLPDAALPTGAKRLAGLDRYATNAAVLGEFDLDYSKIYLAKGEDANMVDALAGSALAALTNSPIVLVDWNNTIASAKELLSAHITDDSEVIALGGSAVVPNSVIDAVEALKPSNNTTELKVESVTADNLKQIKVTFNKAVTDDDLKDAVEDEGNYEIDDSDDDKIDDAIDTVELDDSGKVATITLEDNTSRESPLDNQEDYTLVIDEEVLGSETKIDFTPEDTEIPEALSAKVIGIDTVKVTFSEPMKPDEVKTDSKGNKTGYLDKDGFSVNDGDYNIKQVELVNDNTEANIVLYSDLKDGEELTVKVKADAEDYAGYSVKSNSFDLTVVEDTEAPEVVGFKDADRHKVTLVFNEDIKENGTIVVDTDDDPEIYHTNKHNPAETAKISGNELKLTFSNDNELPAGTAYVYIVDDTIQDLWENENDDITAKIEIVADDVKPTVKKVEQGDTEKELVVTYSEEVDEDTATDDENYKVTNSDGDEERIRNITLNSDGDEATIEMRSDLDTEEEYTLAIEDVEDLEGNVIDKYEGKVTIEDKTAVNLTGSDVHVYVYGTNGTGNADADDQRIVVDFGEKMTVGDDKYAVDDISKYVLRVTDTDTGTSKDYKVEDLYEADIDAIDGNTKVELDLPYESAPKTGDDKSFDLDDHNADNYTYELLIARIADADGNVSDALMSDPIAVTTDIKTIGFDDVPKATDKDVIEFSFDDTVDFDADEDTVEVYYYKPGSTTRTPLTVSKYETDENDDGDTAVKLTLDDDLNTDVTTTGQPIYIQLDKDVQDEATNDDGAKLKNTVFDETKVDDEIAPEVATKKAKVADKYKDFDDVSIEFDGTDNKKAYITIKMTEDIALKSLSTGTFEPEDDDYKVTDVKLGASNEIVLTVEYSGGLDIGKGFGIDQKYGLTDNSLNKNEVTDIHTEVNFDENGDLLD